MSDIKVVRDSEGNPIKIEVVLVTDSSEEQTCSRCVLDDERFCVPELCGRDSNAFFISMKDLPKEIEL